MSDTPGPDRPIRAIERGHVGPLLRQAATGVGIVTAAGLALLAFGAVVALVVAWLSGAA